MTAAPDGPFLDGPLLDAALTAAYAEEAALYGQALALAEQIAADDSRGHGVEAPLTRIREVLGQVEKIEQRLAPVKAQWHKGNYRPTATLAETLGRVAELIHQMQGHLNSARVDAELRKQDLAPALDECIRQRQMRRAYRG